MSASVSFPFFGGESSKCPRVLGENKVAASVLPAVSSVHMTASPVPVLWVQKLEKADLVLIASADASGRWKGRQP